MAQSFIDANVAKNNQPVMALVTSGDVVMALTQDASGSPSNHLLSDSLQAAALKAASGKGRNA